MNKKLLTTEQAVEEMVKTSKKHGAITLATDIKGFYWYVGGKKSPHAKYVDDNAIKFESDMDEVELLNKLIEKGLTFQSSGCGGFYYLIY